MLQSSQQFFYDRLIGIYRKRLELVGLTFEQGDLRLGQLEQSGKIFHQVFICLPFYGRCFYFDLDATIGLTYHLVRLRIWFNFDAQQHSTKI